MSKNLDAYMKLDKANLQNKYVILIEGQVVAEGEYLETMMEDVRQRFPGKVPFVAKVTDKRALVL